MSETCVIIFQVRPSQRARFLALLGPVLDAMRHEASFVRAALDALLERPRDIRIWTVLRADRGRAAPPGGCREPERP